MSLRELARPAAVAVGSLLLATGLAACSPESIIENAIEDQTGVKVDEEDDSFTVTDDEGTTTEFNQEDDGWVTITSEDGGVYTQGPGIPEDFPGAVPLIDMPVTLGVSSVAADGSMYMLTLESEDSCTGVYEDVVSRLTGAGYSEESSTVMEADGYFAMGTYQGDYTVNVSVADDDGGCTVGYTVASIEG